MFKEHFNALNQNGYIVIPCIGKKPCIPQWTQLQRNDIYLKQQYPNHNVGILLGNELVAIDIDITDDECAKAVGLSVLEKFGKQVPMRIGMAPKHLFLFRTNENLKKQVVTLTSPANQKHIIEFLANGQQLIAFGEHPSTQRAYKWSSKSPINIAANELPLITFSDITDFVGNLKNILPSGWIVSHNLNKQIIEDDNNQFEKEVSKVHSSKSSNNSTHISYGQLKSYLNDITNYDDYHNWVKIGMCLHNYDKVNGLELWKEWSSNSDKYKFDVCEEKWATFDNSPANPLSIGTIIQQAKNIRQERISREINNCKESEKLFEILECAKHDKNINNAEHNGIINEVNSKYQSLTNRKLTKEELNPFCKNEYELQDEGVYFYQEKKGIQTSVKICGHLSVEAITHDNNSRSFGRYLKFKNTLNVINYCYMPMSTLVDKSGAAHKELVDKGLYIENDCFNHVIKYINLASNLSSVQITNKIGWHNDSFVFADKTVGKQDIFYQSNSFNISNPYSELGTLEDWQQNISRYCVGNPLLMFAVSISFSGALLKLCEQPIGIGFHIYGASSKGKSTISNVAASVFGKPSGYIRNWRTTTNGLEGVAVAYNDSTLILDELSQIKPNELGNAIYMLINGSGRSRADRSGDAKNTKKWQISVLSNGEKSVATHSAEEQEDINAGQMIRLLNIPLWGKFGAFDSLHDLASGEELTKKLTSSYLKNHGVAGIKWIEALLSHSENYSKMLDVMIDDFKNEIDQYSLSLTSQDMRALNSFAVVALAGDLATAFGITKWKPRQSLLSAVQCFLNWKSSSAAVNDIVYTGADIENTKILQSMKNFLDVHGNSRFFDISNGYDKTKIIHNSAGFKKFGMDGQIMYIFNDISFKQAFKGHDLTIAINTFKDAGWLLFDVKRHKKSHCINGRTQKLYTIVIPDDGVVDSDEYVDDFFERPKKCVGWG